MDGFGFAFGQLTVGYLKPEWFRWQENSEIPVLG
jgi:hypothetical protein